MIDNKLKIYFRLIFITKMVLGYLLTIIQGLRTDMVIHKLPSDPKLPSFK